MTVEKLIMHVGFCLNKPSVLQWRNYIATEAKKLTCCVNYLCYNGYEYPIFYQAG